MTKVFCDMCGQECGRPFKELVRVHVDWYTEQGEEHRTLDICPTCRANLFLSMKLKP